MLLTNGLIGGGILGEEDNESLSTSSGCAKCCELLSELSANSFREFWVHHKNLLAFLTRCTSDGNKSLVNIEF